MAQSSGSAQGCGSVFSLSWGIDPWGNRTDQNVTAGTCNSFHQAVNTLNRFSASPFLYDAAGNLLADGVHSYSYDAENRLQSVDSGSTARYVYDADGRRVRKTAGSAVTYYLYGADGQVVSERDGSNNWLQSYIHFGGTLLAVYRGTVTGFLHQDRLGSTRLVTLADKSVYDNMDFLAFGEQIEGGSGVTHKFTGAERDGTVTSETGFDYMQARHYSSLFGRFLTPDPAGMGAADLTNPQSLNQYAYVMNNPANMTDPTGTDPWDEWGGGFGGGLGGFGGCVWCEGGPSLAPPPMIPSWSGIPLPGPSQGQDPTSMIIDNFHRNDNGNLEPDWWNFCWLPYFSSWCSGVILEDARDIDTKILNKTKELDVWKMAFDNSNAEIVKARVYELERQNLYIDLAREAQAAVAAAGHDNPVSGPLGLATDQRGNDRNDNNRKIRDLLQGAGLSGIQPHPPK